MKPHFYFDLMRADEVAETWEGVTEELYRALWNKVVPHQKPIPNIEDNGPADVVGIGCLSKHWDLLSEDEQVQLNALAETREEEINQLMRR